MRLLKFAPFIDIKEHFMSQQIAKPKLPEVVQEILRAVESLRFGSVEITVHEGRITQIEKREKVRFAPAGIDKTL